MPTGGDGTPTPGDGRRDFVRRALLALGGVATGWLAPGAGNLLPFLGRSSPQDRPDRGSIFEPRDRPRQDTDDL